MDPRALPVDVAVTTDELAHIQTLGRDLFATGRAA
jgi:hypothetical protein